MPESIIGRFLNLFYPSQGHSATILGLEDTGKTTFLYLLATGRVVDTIPTIGINVETVKAPTSGTKQLKFTGWDIGSASCGGGIRHSLGLGGLYTLYHDALIWMVDGSAWKDLSDSINALQRLLTYVDLHAEKNKSPIPVLILLNKSDIPGGMPIYEVRLKFAQVTSNHMVSIFATSMVKSLEESGLPQAFVWLTVAIEMSKANNPTKVPESHAVIDPNSLTTPAQILDTWLLRLDGDVSAEEFLSQFNSFSLPKWDHYAHVRLAYIMLIVYGRQKGKDMIFLGIEKYLAGSSQTAGRTFHVSMTYFWIQMIHFGIRSMPSSSHSPIDDFGRFLIMNPSITDGGLWKEYYSKEVMMSPKAKGEMVLPDRKPLPSLIVRDSIKGLGGQET